MSKRSKPTESESASTDASDAAEKPSTDELASDGAQSLDQSATDPGPQTSGTRVSAYSATGRPTEDELLAAAKAGGKVRVTLLPPLHRAKVAGLPLGDQPLVVPVSRVADFGRDYLRALAIDERIAVAFVSDV